MEEWSNERIHYQPKIRKMAIEHAMEQYRESFWYYRLLKKFHLIRRGDKDGR